MIQARPSKNYKSQRYIMNNQTLQNDQQFLKEELHPHAVWLFVMRSFSYLIATIFFLGTFAAGLIFEMIEDGVDVEAESIFGFLIKNFWLFVILGGVLCIGAIVWAFLLHKSYKFQLKENIFQKEYGVIRKHYVSIPYSRIQNIDIRRGILARFLGLSSVYIQTAGYGAAAAGYSRFGLFGIFRGRIRKRRRESEGLLPGLGIQKAIIIRDELIHRARAARSVGGL